MTSLHHHYCEFLSSFIRARLIILQFRAGLVQVYNTLFLQLTSDFMTDRRRMLRTVSSAFVLSLPFDSTSHESLWKLARMLIYNKMLLYIVPKCNKEKLLFSTRIYLFLSYN